MPSTKPRIALTCPPELMAALLEVSEASGRPVASLAVEFLTEMIPHMQGLAKVIRATKSGNQNAAKRAMAHMVGDTLAGMLEASQPELFASKRRGSK